MAKKNALGRGLGALIQQSETRIPESRVNVTNNIDIRQIETNPFQPRSNFDQEALEELASSIKQLGIIQPITVREVGNDKYQIISGERRYRASLIAGLTEIPAFIRHADDNNMLELALVENIQREDLDAMEVAISYQRLMDECQLTQENVSERVGKKRSTITNYLRLLKLPAEIQLAIRQRQIGMGHARALINIEEPEQQLNLLQDILDRGLSVRQVEDAVRRFNHPEETVQEVIFQSVGQVETTENQNTEPEQASRDTDTENDTTREKAQDEEVLIYEDNHPPVDSEDEHHLEEQLGRFFGAKVDLKRNISGSGRITITFRTDAELQYILQKTERVSDD